MVSNFRTFDEFCLTLLKLIISALPNFFPYLYFKERDLFQGEHLYVSLFKHDQTTWGQLGKKKNVFVYKGKLGDRDIAIKRVKKDHSPSVEKEISTLLMNNDHPNVLEYYAKEVDEKYFYIGAELGEFNLETFIADKTLKEKMLTTQILQQLAEGLHYLHKNSISK